MSGKDKGSDPPDKTARGEGQSLLQRLISNTIARSQEVDKENRNVEREIRNGARNSGKRFRP